MITAFIFLSFIKVVFLNPMIVSKGDDHNFTNFKSGNDYEYYTDCQLYKNVTITVTMKYIDNNPFTNFSVYEKYYKSGSNQIKYQNINPQTNIKNNELILSYSFVSKIEGIRYVGILFKPKYNPSYIVIRFDIENPSFELEYGILQNFTNLLPCNYNFFIKCRQSQTIEISFTMNSYSSNQWTIYEVKEKIGPYIINKIINPRIIEENNKAILSYSYKCDKLETNYIKIEMPLSTNTKYIVSLFTSKGGAFDLDNGVPKTINGFFGGYTYLLFLKGIECGQKVSISLSMEYINDNPFKETSVSEYSPEYEDSVNKYKIEPKLEKNNLLNILFSFIIKYEGATSFALCLTPNYDIDYITAKIEANYIYYNFINGIPQNITSFIKPFPYFFYINAKPNQQAIITIDMNYNPNSPFSLDIYEYKQIIYKYNNYIKQSLNQKYTFINNKIEYTYLISSNNANYVAFCIRPKYNINYLLIKIEVGGEIFDLNNGIPINGLNLTARFPYYFSIPIKQYQKANFILSIDKNNITPLNEIYIYEYNSYKYIPNIKIEDNKKIISTSHVLLSNSKNTISFYINPISNIYEGSVIINVGGESFDLDNGISKSIKSLKAGYPYIFFLNINQYKIANFNIKLNNVNKNPFSIINIQELYSKTNPSSTFNNIQPNISFIDNNTIISISYQIHDTSSKYLALNATSIYDINNLEINAEVGGGNFECSNGFMTNLKNVKSGYPYYFFININQFENSSFILTMENTNSNPFDYLVLYEYENYNKNSKNSTHTFESKIENNELILHFSYFTNSYKRVAFHIIPKSNIDNLNVKINNGGGYYSLSKSINYYRNIISGKSYYFSLNATTNYSYNNPTINILFIMNYVNDNQLNQIKTYEYSSNNILSSYNQYTVDYIPSIKRENNNKKELVSMYSYTIKSHQTNYVVFQITPNNDIDRIDINYDFDSDNKITNPFIFILSCFFIALPLLIIIILAGFFIRKEDILKADNNRNNSSLI